MRATQTRRNTVEVRSIEVCRFTEGLRSTENCKEYGVSIKVTQ